MFTLHFQTLRMISRTVETVLQCCSYHGVGPIYILLYVQTAILNLSHHYIGSATMLHIDLSLHTCTHVEFVGMRFVSSVFLVSLNLHVPFSLAKTSASIAKTSASP